jgi:hypothetical protein
MRRSGILVLAVLVVLTMTGPVAAQPKVTITGFIDHISSYTRNLSIVDLNLARSSDDEWYARTRIRPDITAEVGTTKFVLGLEMDSAWGQTGATDNTAPNRFGTTSSFDLNTDIQGIIELKWAYTEFSLPGVPMATRVRVGAQPWAALYKGGVFASGDFAGVHVTSQWAPMLKSNLTFVQIEEGITGTKDAFIRGDDVGFVASVEVTPFKGLDIRPIFSYVNLIGVTSGASRLPRGGLGVGAAVFPTCPGTAGPGTGGCLGGGITSAEEDRFTVGVDARWRFGPFSLDPTVLYQFGNRDQISPIASATSGPGVMSSLRRDAWYVDLRAGWQLGPLLLEGIGVYTTGNSADDRIDLNRNRIKYFEPISLDNGWFATWSELQASSIDYFNRIRPGGGGALNPGVSIGYDKYGMIAAGGRASYALTPAFTVRAMGHARWTAEEVDTASTVAAATGLTPRCAAAALDAGTCTDEGSVRYYGTELNLGFQWRLAPSVVFDLVGSYLFVGNALSSPAITSTTGVVQSGRDPDDVHGISARLRYSF